MKHKHHKIIFKNGKRIRTNELILYTIEEHANEHKRLYEKYGHWKDKLAWQGLSGQIGKEKLVQKLLSENGRNNIKYLQTPEVKKRSIMRTKQVNTGRKLSDEHKAKIVRTGQKQPESQKIKVAEALSKEYIIEAPNGTKYNIKNLRQFALKKGLDQGNLTKVAQRKLVSHKGYKVQYK